MTRSTSSAPRRDRRGSVQRHWTLIASLTAALMAGACSQAESDSAEPPPELGNTAAPAGPSQPATDTAAATGQDQDGPSADPTDVASTAQPESGDGRSPSAFPVGHEWRELVPVLAEMQSVHEAAHREWQRRIQTCMGERGFDYAPAQAVDERRTELYRAMNPLNEQAAKVYGYHTPPTPEIGDRNTDSSEAFEVALVGTDENPSTGCASIAFEDVYALVTPASDPLDALLTSLDEQVWAYASSREGRAQTQRWADCMSTRGYDVNDRDELIERFVVEEDVTDQEIQARLTDIACDSETRFTEQRSAWERERVEQWLDDSAPAFQELSGRIETALSALTTLSAQD